MQILPSRASFHNDFTAYSTNVGHATRIRTGLGRMKICSPNQIDDSTIIVGAERFELPKAAAT